MKGWKLWIILLSLSLVLIGCSSSNDRDDAEELNANITVYTTVYPLQYLVEEISGDSIIAHSIFPPGVDGHMYEPTSKEMANLAKSDAFIYMGAGMEGFADSISDALGSEDVQLVEIGETEELFQKGIHTSSSAGEDDEHVIEIQGLADHYHTGDTIQLSAHLQIDSEHDHWH